MRLNFFLPKQNKSLKIKLKKSERERIMRREDGFSAIGALEPKLRR